MKELRHWLMQLLIYIPAIVAASIFLISNEAILELASALVVSLYIWIGAGRILAWLRQE